MADNKEKEEYTPPSKEELEYLKLKEISMDEIAKHNKEESPWLLIHGRVYDVAKYMDNHPGGPEILVENSGKDATEEYDDIGHSDDATQQMAEYCIGRVKGVAFDEVSGKSGGGSGGGSGGMSLVVILAIIAVLVAVYYKVMVLDAAQ